MPLRRRRCEWRPLVWLVAAYAAIRLLHLWFLDQGLAVEPPPDPGPTGSTDQRALLDALTAWDGGWYLRIAEHGYPGQVTLLSVRDDASAPLAFPPLYPMAMRALGSLGMSAAGAGLLISSLAGLAAVIGVYAVARDLVSRRAAWLTGALWAAGPMTIVLSMVYAEALFVALAAWALWCAQRDWWLSAGLLGLLAGLTRTTGLAVAAALAVGAALALTARRQVIPGPSTPDQPAPGQPGPGQPAPSLPAESQPTRGQSAEGQPVSGQASPRHGDDRGSSAGGRWRPIVGAVLGLAGVPLWWLYVALVGERAGAWFEIQEFFWGSRLDFGASVLENGWRMLTFDGRFDPMVRFVYTLSFFAMLTAAALLASLLIRAHRARRHADRRRWWPVAAYAAVLVVLAVGSAGFPHSKIRFLIPMFPLLLLPAVCGARLGRPTQVAVVLLMAVASGWFGAFMLTVWPYAI